MQKNKCCILNWTNLCISNMLVEIEKFFDIPQSETWFNSLVYNPPVLKFLITYCLCWYVLLPVRDQLYRITRAHLVGLLPCILPQIHVVLLSKLQVAEIETCQRYLSLSDVCWCFSSQVGCNYLITPG